MSFLASLTGSKAIVSVLAIGAGGVLGYNWVTTGCPSGACPTDAPAAAVLPVSDTAETADDCCALADAAMADKADCAAECDTPCTDKATAEAGNADSCCALTAELTAVALTTETAEADACCAAETKSECDSVACDTAEKATADDCCASKAETQQTATNAP